MAVPKFDVGDIVRLKSGSPDMTVDHVKTSNIVASHIYRCNWFDGALLQTASLREEVLELTPTTPPYPGPTLSSQS